MSVAAIEALSDVMATYPQVELSTNHYFADGMYCREVPRPAGTLIVGKVHRKEHFYFVMSGIVLITDGNEVARRVVGPRIIVSRPGTKRAVYAQTDAVCATVHRTPLTDLDEIERELVEFDRKALFDARNELKRPALEAP